MPDEHKLSDNSCISIIGMPGAGKSALGKALAAQMQWSFIDSDYIIEAIYGVRLQAVTDSMSKDAFLDVEAAVITSLRAKRTIIATGGSAVYRPKAMEYLTLLGPIVHIDVPLAVILERVARNPERGLAINPGQTIEDLYQERCNLYKLHANITISVKNKTPEQCALDILTYLC